MKKLLLTTTLLGTTLFAVAAAAETPKVTLGGFSNFQAGWTSNDADEVEGDDDRSMAFRNDNEVSIHVDGKSDSGLAYGAVIDLEADITGDNDTQHDEDNTDINPGKSTRTFTYLEGGWGRVELGGNKSAAANMRVDASTIAVATGGINGDWRHFVQPNGTTFNANSDNYLTTSKLQMEHGGVDVVGDESTYNVTKATYYTPRFSGFQAGVSYSPDIDAVGQLAQRIDDPGSGDGFGDIWEAALAYAGEFSGFRVNAAVAGNWAPSDVSTDDDISGWNAGALLGWNSWSLAGSYGKWSEGAFIVASPGSNSFIDDGRDDVDADYWTLGLAYNTGPYGLSATYIDSSYEDSSEANDFSNFVLGADYKVAPGLTTYVEAAFYDFDNEDAGDSNEGSTVIVGTQVAY